MGLPKVELLVVTLRSILVVSWPLIDQALFTYLQTNRWSDWVIFQWAIFYGPTPAPSIFDRARLNPNLDFTTPATTQIYTPVETDPDHQLIPFCGKRQFVLISMVGDL